MSKAPGHRRVNAGPAPENPSRKRLPSGRQGGLFECGSFGYRASYKREQATERQSAADARTALAQLDRLNARFGFGKGAAREWAKLTTRLAGPAPTNPRPTSTEGKAIVTVRGSGAVPPANQDRRRNKRQNRRENHAAK
jgi:hypothetical protein